MTETNVVTTETTEIAPVPAESSPDAAFPSAEDSVERALAKLSGDEPAGADKTIESDEPKGERARDPTTGKFVKADGDGAKPSDDVAPKPESDPAKAPEKTKAEPQPTAESPKPASPAPTGFSAAAQAEWGNTPEPVRAEVERRLSELTTGLEQHRTIAKQSEQAMAPIKPYLDMAAQHGTTLDKALENYVAIEQRLHQDPVNGFLQLCTNLGVHPGAIGQALMGIKPQPGGGESNLEVSGLKRTIADLERRLETFTGQVEQSFTKQREADAARRTEETVDAFFADKEKHPYVDELEPVMAELLETNFAKSLDDAYEKAIRLTPEVAAKIEADKAAKATPAPDPAHTRKAQLSVTGSPSAGSHPSERKPSRSAEESVDNVFEQLGIS